MYTTSEYKNKQIALDSKTRKGRDTYLAMGSFRPKKVVVVAGADGSSSRGGIARLNSTYGPPAASRSFSSFSRSSSFTRRGECFFLVLRSFSGGGTVTPSALLEERESSSSGRRSSSSASLAARICARVRRGAAAAGAGL